MVFSDLSFKMADFHLCVLSALIALPSGGL